METMHRFQQSTGIGTCGGTSTCSGTCIGTSSGTCSSIGIGA